MIVNSEPEQESHYATKWTGPGALPHSGSEAATTALWGLLSCCRTGWRATVGLLGPGPGPGRAGQPVSAISRRML